MAMERGDGREEFIGTRRKAKHPIQPQPFSTAVERGAAAAAG
jgi:hypothetical protein